jgi:integrase
MRQTNKLAALTIDRLRVSGLYPDGGGLYLQVTQGSNGAPCKSWLFRFEIDGRERRMGLGSLAEVSLKQAREKAANARKVVSQGDDPIEARRAERTAAVLRSAQAITFDQCRDAHIAAHRAGWRNAKHAALWTNTLTTYVTPIFGSLPVRAIDTALVMKVLEQEVLDAEGKGAPLWTAKPETASRVRGRIERILDWAKVRGYRANENPARWRGHLDHLLPKKSKVRAVKHHAALNYTELPAFMLTLRERQAVAARALEFAILTAARTGEVIGAAWDEIDLQAKVWTVPAERMKASREHRVPLSEPALAVLKRMQKVRENNLVFPGDRRVALSNMALLMTLRRMDRGDLTAHGFRSTFRTWVAEQTSFPRELAEAALAHIVGDATEQAYQRGDLFEKRRRLMTAWGAYCFSDATGKVISIKSKHRFQPA